MKYAILLLLLAGCSQTQYGTVTCGSEVVNKSNVDATPTLQSCFNSYPKGYSIELLPGRYYIDGTLDLNGHSDQKISTKGLTRGPACFLAGAPDCAVLVASATNKGPVILKAAAAANLQFDHIGIDGNNAIRRLTLNNQDFADDPSLGLVKTAYNVLFIQCDGCTFTGVASINAAQGTGFGFSGTNGVFDGVNISNNGFGQPNYVLEAAWADGLTIGNAPGLIIKNSIFSNNSDVDLILGSAPGATVENNYIENTTNFAFASVMLHVFDPRGLHDFRGFVFRNNTISCPNSACGIGFMLGSHYWARNFPSIAGGDIYGNAITGGKFGFMVAGATGTKIHNNYIATEGTFINPALCEGNAFALEAGNEVSIKDNNTSPVALTYGVCGPTELSSMVLKEAI